MLPASSSPGFQRCCPTYSHKPHVTLTPHPGPRLPGQPRPGRGPLRLGLSPHGKCSPSNGGLSWNDSCLHQPNKAFPKPCPLHQTGDPPRRGQCLPALRSGPGAPQAGLGFPPHTTGPLGEWGFFAPSEDAQSCLPLLLRPRQPMAPRRGLSVLWCGCRSSLPAQAHAGLGVPGPPAQPPAPTPTDLQRSPRRGEGPVAPPRGSRLLLAAPPREDLGR